MSGVIGCDYNCERSNNINKLRRLYNKELDKYQQLYTGYMQRLNDTSANAVANKTFAESQLKPQIEQSNKKLNNILEELKNNIKTTDQSIVIQKAGVNSKTSEIYKKNKVLKGQNSDIDRKRNELITKDRQNEFTLQRNNYRFNIMYSLIITDIVLITGLYYVYSKGL